MPSSRSASLDARVGLLERAIGYTRLSLQHVAATPLSSPTPCRAWTLAQLLAHMDDSLAAFCEGAAVGYVDLAPTASPGPDVVASLRARACAVLGAWNHHEDGAEVSVSGRPLPPTQLLAAGALEITVHGWDVAASCGAPHDLPPRLAAALWRRVPSLVSDADRPGHFGPPVDVPAWAPVSHRLLGFLGRDPEWGSSGS